MAILRDTSLCAIVRDEKMNPAGGIARFIDSHVPYVESAVIADTGSVDGTRERLEEMQAKYPNLKIVDIQFRNYADARNKALMYVETERVLILDADELICHERPQNDWIILREAIDRNHKAGYDLKFDEISPDKTIVHTLNPFTKLFNMSERAFFKNAVWEKLPYLIDIGELTGMSVKHFVPTKSAINLKRAAWYIHLPHYWENNSPSQTTRFAEWKAFNPLRDDYV